MAKNEIVVCECFAFHSETCPKKYENMTPAQFAAVIRADWKKPFFGSVPYIEAMADLPTWESRYICDSAKEIVVTFLSNASGWRGPVAKAAKKAMNDRLLSKTTVPNRVVL